MPGAATTRERSRARSCGCSRGPSLSCSAPSHARPGEAGGLAASGRAALSYPGAAMKIVKTVLYAAVILGAVAAFGWFFVSQLSPGGSGGRTDGLAGVLLSPPPGYALVERGELSPAAAAAELQSQALQPG